MKSTGFIEVLLFFVIIVGLIYLGYDSGKINTIDRVFNSHVNITKTCEECHETKTELMKKIKIKN